MKNEAFRGSRAGLLLAAMLAASGVGCLVEVDAVPIVRGAYEACGGGDRCASGTTCMTATYSLTGRPGALCSVTCAQGVQCPLPSRAWAYAPTCVVSASSGVGMCYSPCLVAADCYPGTTCVAVPGTNARVCVPAT